MPPPIYHPDIQAQISSLALSDPFSNENMYGIHRLTLAFQEVSGCRPRKYLDEDLQPIGAQHVAEGRGHQYQQMTFHMALSQVFVSKLGK